MSDAYTTAISEAKRFIKAAEAAQKRISADELAAMTGCKETAAAKRASMDLSRALADLRGNNKR